VAIRYRDQQAGDDALIAEINTTPLVDVMLVLLVIFIITAPLFQQAVPIDLPKVDAKPIENEPKVIQFAIDADGGMFINGELVTKAMLGERLRAAVKPGESPELHLRADRVTPYERVTEAMAAAQQVGITKIAFVTDGASDRALEK
jgi:biopolymer transport protein ExbD